ncbi:MAG: BTAD domain-containing putative transcriptional regulator, partial [Actinomycetota bacterium]|nr:BTAD domain-containing putative transcriptional regulator [Actinomycetota bacterium]
MDGRRVEAAASEGRQRLADGDPHAARELLDRALAMWHGPSLVDVADEEWAAAEARHRDELR